jgi:hypothetical protein
MHNNRGPHKRQIELRLPSLFPPVVKSFLLVAAIGAIGGGGYFLTRSHLIHPGMFGFGVDPAREVATTGRSDSAPEPQGSEGEASASESKADQTSASVTEPHASAPKARVQTEYVPPTRGRVLGASTDATQPSGSTLDRSIAALKEIADQFAATVTQLRAELGSNKQVIVSYSGPPAVTLITTQTFAQGQRIDQLQNTAITNPHHHRRLHHGYQYRRHDRQRHQLRPRDDREPDLNHYHRYQRILYERDNDHSRGDQRYHHGADHRRKRIVDATDFITRARGKGGIRGNVSAAARGGEGDGTPP